MNKKLQEKEINSAYREQKKLLGNALNKKDFYKYYYETEKETGL